MATRRPHDYYPTTHAGATLGLLHSTPVVFHGTALECCSGQHHMSTVLRDSGFFSRVYTNDIVPSLEADFHEDATDPQVWDAVFPEVDWVITNPTFKFATPILKQALRRARVGVAFYLRLTYWEPTIKHKDPSMRRGGLLAACPPTGFMPMSRISHTEDGHTDSVTCAWFVWQKDVQGFGPFPQWHKVLILGDSVNDDHAQDATKDTLF